MSTQPLEQAIATTRGVLANVSPDQLDADTPCAQWKVRELVNHIVGGQVFFEQALAGQPPAGEVDYSSTDFLAAFDEASARTLAAFGAEGALQKMVTLPFGQMPGAAWMGLASTDTFTHGWDLAKATGQDTNLNPELAGQLLGQSKMMIQDAFRSEEGTVFGLEQQAPEGSCPADQLAAFLGRSVV